MEFRVILKNKDFHESHQNLSDAEKAAIRENAVVEINNLLVTQKLLDVKIDDIQRIAHKYKINIKKDFRDEWFKLYKTYLRHCLTDRYLSEDELLDLRHLKSLLILTDKEISNLHNEIAADIYREEMDVALEDGKIDEHEKDFLKKLQSDLKISDELCDKIFLESAQDMVRKFVNLISLDKRLTPQEENDLEELKRNLNIDIQFTDSSVETLQKYKLFWLVENEGIPEIQLDINLAPGEKGYYSLEGEWLERENEAKIQHDDNLELRIKIAKGIYWTLLNLKENKINDHKWESKGVSKIFITSKQIIFSSPTGNRFIPLNKILDLKPHLNGIEIIGFHEPMVMIQFGKNVDVVMMILGRAIHDIF